MSLDFLKLLKDCEITAIGENDEGQDWSEEFST